VVVANLPLPADRQEVASAFRKGVNVQVGCGVQGVEGHVCRCGSCAPSKHVHALQLPYQRYPAYQHLAVVVCCLLQVQAVRHRPTPAEPWVVVDLTSSFDMQAVLQVRYRGVSHQGWHDCHAAFFFWGEGAGQFVSVGLSWYGGSGWPEPWVVVDLASSFNMQSVLQVRFQQQGLKTCLCCATCAA
jgi:hypothetical protein